MGWRTDFKKSVETELSKIDGIGYVSREWIVGPPSFPALLIQLVDESYEEFQGTGRGTIEVNFQIIGSVNDVDDPDEALDDLHNEMIEKLSGVSVSGVTIEKVGTVWHEKMEGVQKGFTFRGVAVQEKDYSNM